MAGAVCFVTWALESVKEMKNRRHMICTLVVALFAVQALFFAASALAGDRGGSSGRESVRNGSVSDRRSIGTTRSGNTSDRSSIVTRRNDSVFDRRSTGTPQGKSPSTGDRWFRPPGWQSDSGEANRRDAERSVDTNRRDSGFYFDDSGRERDIGRIGDRDFGRDIYHRHDKSWDPKRDGRGRVPSVYSYRYGSLGFRYPYSIHDRFDSRITFYGSVSYYGRDKSLYGCLDGDRCRDKDCDRNFGKDGKCSDCLLGRTCSIHSGSSVIILDGRPGLSALRNVRCQAYCPFHLKTIHREYYLDYSGYRIFTCGEKCLKRLQKDPKERFERLRDAGFVLEKIPDRAIE